jgi:hypothetical protein
MSQVQRSKGLAVRQGGATVRDDVVDQVVVELNQLQARVTLETAIEMGRIIVTRFYGGDLRDWREHRSKEVSFRRLAARAERDLAVSPSNLYRAVALYELTRRLNIGADSTLTMTHLRSVVGLTEEHQTALLASARAMHWSSERLEREAARVRSTMTQRRGRIPSPPAIRAARKLVRTWQHLESAIDDQAVLHLSAEELQSLYRTMNEVRARLETLTLRLGQGNIRRIDGVA